jgi:hypothetical protein
MFPTNRLPTPLSVPWLVLRHNTTCRSARSARLVPEWREPADDARVSDN